AERRQPIPPPTGIGAAFHADALEQRAERHPLRESGQKRAACERKIPEPLMRLVAPAELEGDTAKNQREQHRDDRRIERRHDDRIGERKRRHQPAAAQHQPGLVAIPDRRDGVHRLIALLSTLEQREQDADAQIEAVEHDIGKNRESKDESPENRKMHVHSPLCSTPSARSGATAATGVVPAVRIGAGSFSSPDSCSAGAWAISRNMYQTPTEKTAK